MHDKRLEIKDSRPDIMPADVMTKTVEAWNNISDKERKHYEERAALMKKAYAEEMAKYKAEHGTPAVESEEDDSPVVPAPTKAPRAKKAKEPVVEAAVVEEEPKKAEAVTNGAPEKRKKKSASAGGVAENAGDRDSEKKKKKKKSHKSKHSESQ
ncbi:hypothetical protein FBU31_001425 [Coemansia sp. 'formosensis']|nr:hypothetical protein FBU31_001425 [Coemansia sp. 'formosensis']